MTQKKCNHITHASIILLLLLPIFSPAISFKDIPSWLGMNIHEEITQKEYTIKKSGKVVIENISGSISVQTSQHGGKVFMKAIKKTKKEQDLSNMHVKTKVTDDTLFIKTKKTGEETKGTIEYELIVPAHVQLCLNTNEGNISVKETFGSINAITEQGEIKIVSTHGSINTKVLKKGSIEIEHAQGPVQATIHRGNITASHTYHSIFAVAEKGNISIVCNVIPSNSSIQLKAITGTITLSFPPTTNATIQAYAPHGTITSDHFITLKSHTTKLNKFAWDRFKKEVNGTLGTGEAAITCRSVQRGNIKIKETTTV